MQIPVKVKATGEIVDVNINVAVAGNPLYTTSGGVTYLGDDIEPAEPNWQQVRIDATIKIEGSILSNYDFFGQAIQTECNNTGKTRTQVIAQMAVELADDLVKELQKKDDNANV